MSLAFVATQLPRENNGSFHLTASSPIFTMLTSLQTFWPTNPKRQYLMSWEWDSIINYLTNWAFKESFFLKLGHLQLSLRHPKTGILGLYDIFLTLLMCFLCLYLTRSLIQQDRLPSLAISPSTYWNDKDHACFFLFPNELSSSQTVGCITSTAHCQSRAVLSHVKR